MKNSEAVEILKSAILAEMRGEAFYQNVADQAKDKEVKEFFMLMAREEENHKVILLDQLKELGEGRPFKPGTYIEEETSQVANKILNSTVVKKISGAGFESAAIVAAMSMEQAAVKLYGARRDATQDKEEKALYAWLTKWEQVHFNELYEMDQALREEIWADNHFFAY